MPEEELKLTDKELVALQRLADRHGLTPEDVLETVAVQAIVQECKPEDPQA